MLLRTVDKHLICTVFTAPIILDIVIILRKAPCKNLTYVKKNYLLLLHIYYYGTAMKFGSVIYICNFFKEIYTTPQLFLEECRAAILYSIASCNIFINFFPLHFYKLHPKYFKLLYLHHTSICTHLHTILYTTYFIYT